LSGLVIKYSLGCDPILEKEKRDSKDQRSMTFNRNSLPRFGQNALRGQKEKNILSD
jgi:hypothetical protein